LMVASEIEIVLDERSADKVVVADRHHRHVKGLRRGRGRKKIRSQEKLRLPGAMC
jgi:hypothetical protein